MGASDQSTNEVVFVIEVTANVGAYIDLLKTNYIIPTLEYFNNGAFDKLEFSNDYGCSQYAVVFFNTADCSLEPASTCSGPTTSAQKVLSWINNVQFVGGAGEGHSHVAEGLSTSLQVFDDFQALRDPNANVQKHCILVCNSPPYPIPSMESLNYSNYHAEQLATLLSERAVNLSIISPRKISALYKIYEMAGGDPQLPSAKSFAQDRRHLVLLKGYQLRQRPVSPTQPTNTGPSPVNEKMDIKPIVTPVQSNIQKKSPGSVDVVQGQMKPPSTLPGNNLGMQNQQNPNIPGQIKPRVPTPITTFAPQSTAMTVIVTVNPNMPTFTSSNSSNLNQLMGAKTSAAAPFPLQNDIRNPTPNVSMAPRWSQASMQTTPSGQPVTIQAQNMPLLTNRLMQQPSLIGPGQARMTTTQQKNPQIAPTSFAASVNQPVMVATVSTASLQSQLNATKPTMPVSSLPANTMSAMQQSTITQPLGLQNMASQPQMSASTTTASISSQQPMAPQTTTILPGGNVQVPTSQMQTQPQRQQKELMMIWQGSLEWKQDKLKTDNPNEAAKGIRSNHCRISCYVINGEPEMAAETWPQVLFMQMMPRQLLASVGQMYFSNSKQVTFHFTDPESEIIQGLNKLMASGYVGCVHLSTRGGPQTTIKVIMLLYSPEKNAHVGLIPKDQSNFVNSIRRVITNSQRKMQMSGGTVASGNPTPPSNLQLPTVNNQQGIILSQANPPQVASLQQPAPPPQPPQATPQMQANQAQANQAPQTAAQLELARQIEAERQQNLLQIQQLQQTLEAAKQKEMQFKAAQDRHVITQQIQHMQHQQPQPQPRMAQMQQVPQNAANNPQLRHLLQQQAQQQQARHTGQQQHLLIQPQQQQIQQQQQQQIQHQQLQQTQQIPAGNVNAASQPGFVNDVDSFMDFL